VSAEAHSTFWVNLDGRVASSFGREIEALRDFEDEGLLEMIGSEITVTALGRPFVRNGAMIFDACLRAADSVPFSRTI
jgi:oxygen-independent coproporphyrinogen-3 oxidase